MLETLSLFFLLAITIVLLTIYSRRNKYDKKDWVLATFCFFISLFTIMTVVHVSTIVQVNGDADAKLASMLREHEDIQHQIDTYTDEQALAAVMERAEEYNQEVAFGKAAAHSPWNAWSYPAKVFDNLLFVEYPEG